MKKLTITIMFILVASVAQATTITNNFTVTPGPGQIIDNTLPNNDVWLTPWLDTTPSIVELFSNDTYIANIVLNGTVTADDGYFNGMESIHIGVDGEGGVGGAPNNKADYKFWFTGVTGNLLTGTQANPITGQLTVGALNGNVNFDLDVDLINGGSFSFSDIHFELTYTGPNKWQFDKIQAGADADVMTAVPEPATSILLGFGLLGLVGLRSRNKKKHTG